MRARLAVVSLLLVSPAHAGIIHVSDFAELSAAIDSANLDSGSTIYLAPGTYSGGALPFIMASTTFQLDPAFNAPAGSAILNTIPTGSKGLLTVDAATNVNLTVDGLTFQNASISAGLGGNAAGIRYQGSGAAMLTVSNSIFLNNQDGILTGSGVAPDQEQLAISIVNSLFSNNGAPDGIEHALYAYGQSLSVSGSTFCGTIGGHDIKSRAAVTTITGSFLYDGAAAPGQPLCGAGSASYAVDAPNGGQLTLTDNLLVQDDQTQNFAMVSYGEEGLLYANNSLIASGDTFTSTVSGRGIQEFSGGTPSCVTPVQLSNTSFSANLIPVTPDGCFSNSSVQLDEPDNLAMVMASLLFVISLRYRRRVIKAA